MLSSQREHSKCMNAGLGGVLEQVSQVIGVLALVVVALEGLNEVQVHFQDGIANLTFLVPASLDEVDVDLLGHELDGHSMVDDALSMAAVIESHLENAAMVDCGCPLTEAEEVGEGERHLEHEVGGEVGGHLIGKLVLAAPKVFITYGEKR